MRSAVDNPASARGKPCSAAAAAKGVGRRGRQTPGWLGRGTSESEPGGDREGPLTMDGSPDPRRWSRKRSLSPPVYTPTIRRWPPHLSHRSTSMANTRLSSADHDRPDEREDGGEPASATGTSLATSAAASWSTSSWGPGMSCDRLRTSADRFVALLQDTRGPPPLADRRLLRPRGLAGARHLHNRSAEPIDVLQAEQRAEHGR
jgi:hypothetical protein